jgi:hypothetical protein
MRSHPLVVALGLTALAAAQEAPAAPAPAAPRHPAAAIALASEIPWLTDGVDRYDHVDFRMKPQRDRGELIDAAIQQAKAEGKLVLWYIHRIEEQGLGGRQMYRAPVLDVYMRQVVFGDPDVADVVAGAFVPVRCLCDQKLCDRFGIKPLDVVEPAVLFLDGDGKQVHLLERVRTFHAAWFADLCTRVLEHAKIGPKDGPQATDPDALRRGGDFRRALAALSEKPEKDADAWLQIARLQRLLRLPEQALDSVAKAEAVLVPPRSDEDDERRPRRPSARARKQLGDVQCERGLLLAMTGKLLQAQPLLEQAWRSGNARAAEAGYWHALNTLHLGDEIGAMNRFVLVAQRYPDTTWGKRAKANTTIGPDDRPIGAAFTGFETVRYLPEAAHRGLPRTTAWAGDAQAPRDLARGGVEFLLQQQRDDGGFTDARYAYWPTSEITPNTWVAITAIALTALFEYRTAFPDLRERIDQALARGEAFAFDPKRLNEGANEESYSDAYRLMYLARRTDRADGAERARLIARMNELVLEAAEIQRPSGFWAHEYENAFASGAMLQELVAAKNAGATVPTEITDKGAAALVSARFQNGAFSYGGKAGGGKGSLKDSCGRMPVCEGMLLQLGRSDLTKLRAAFDAFWQYMKNLETVRRNDFHSDGELAGFFFFHSVYHASEVVRLLPESERAAHHEKFLALLQRVPEMDGSFVDSHEFGRSYGTAMALLTLANCTR